jgi:hypothetical protein
VNFVPYGVKLSPGVKFSAGPSILLNSRGVTPGGERRGEHSPRGQSSHLGGQLVVKNWPQTLLTIEEERPLNRFNDGKCDPRGKLFAGTMGPETRPGTNPFFKGCPGWGVSQGSFDLVYFLIPSLYRRATAAPQTPTWFCLLGWMR